jgi:hypothetical protein
MVIEHDLHNSNINSTAEAVFLQGTSKLMFDLVLHQLKELQLEYDLHLHIVHVSGKRMIAKGTDGLSRANHGEGVMLGRDIHWFIPLHLDPIE